MAEQLAFERPSYKRIAANILQHAVGEYGIKWCWSGFEDEQRPPNLPYLNRVITFEMVRIGNSLDHLRVVVFDSDRSTVNVWRLWELLDATFRCRPGFPAVIVVCAIIGQLSLYSCRIGNDWLVDQLVDVLAQVLNERVGDSLQDLERYALVKLGRIIPDAA